MVELSWQFFLFNLISCWYFGNAIELSQLTMNSNSLFDKRKRIFYKIVCSKAHPVSSDSLKHLRICFIPPLTILVFFLEWFHGRRKAASSFAGLETLMQSSYSALEQSGLPSLCLDHEKARLPFLSYDEWYLPNHPVVRMDKATTKVRIVFDGSCLGPEWQSLNNYLFQDPATQNDSLGILMRFRTNKVFVMGDIEKLFLQINMKNKDQHPQRFYRRETFTRGCLGLHVPWPAPCSLLRREARRLLQTRLPWQENSRSLHRPLWRS